MSCSSPFSSYPPQPHAFVCFLCSLRFVCVCVCFFFSRDASFCQTSDSRGEALIRPSSKGPDHLSLTWMWIEGEFMHTDIQVRLLATRTVRKPSAPVAPECVEMYIATVVRARACVCVFFFFRAPKATFRRVIKDGPVALGSCCIVLLILQAFCCVAELTRGSLSTGDNARFIR